MFDLFEELRAVTRALDDSGVPYALCGGLAVAVHGHVRATEDIDLLVLPEDLHRAREALEEVGFVMDGGEVPVTPPGGIRTTIHCVGKAQGTDFVSVDLMPVNAATETAWRSRESIRVDDFAIRCISKEALIALKRGTGRAIDQSDAEHLEHGA